MKKINEMMISAYLKGMSKLNAFKDNESGEVNMVAIVLIIIVVIALVAVFKDGISDVLSAAFKKIKGSYRNSVNISLKAIVYMETAHSFLLRADSR